MSKAKTQSKETEWNIDNLYDYILIILNRPIIDKLLFSRILASAQTIICADGGANRLYSWTRESSSSDTDIEVLPDRIVGDLDSIDPAVKEYYASKGVTIQMDHDQDTTDFTKSIVYASHQCDTMQTREDERLIVAFGGLGGRFDQTLAGINLLYTTDQKIILMDHENLMFRLGSGKHRISVRSGDLGHLGIKLGPHCGLVPLSFGRVRQSDPAHAPEQIESGVNCKTKGLKWNLEGDEVMQMGGLVSTNNLLDADVVTVECDGDLLFTLEVAAL